MRNRLIQSTNDWYMKQVTFNTFKFSIVTLALFTIVACSKDKTGKQIDKELYDLANTSEGFVWFKYSDAYLPQSSGSGHNFPKLRTRFNAVAAQMLDSVGKIQTGITFPEGALIVKELVNDDNSLARYAVLLKDSESKFADEQGWVWGYINTDESIAISAVEKGQDCISCHQQSENIDYVLMNKFFP